MILPCLALLLEHDGTFVEENHDLLEGLHEVDVVVAVFLNLLQQDELRLALGTEHSQQGSVLLEQSRGQKVRPGGPFQGCMPVALTRLLSLYPLKRDKMRLHFDSR